jgi:hypothetical protein
MIRISTKKDHFDLMLARAVLREVDELVVQVNESRAPNAGHVAA